MGKRKTTNACEYWNGCHQISGNERKCMKKLPQTNGKTSGNQALWQKSHRRNKQLGSIPCKILGTILKMDKEETQTNGPEGKKVDNDAQGFTFKR